MEYVEFPAPAPLADIVRCVWLLSSPASPSPEPQPVVPDGCAEIVLNLSDQFRRFNGHEMWETQPRSMVVGQITEAVVIAPTGGIDIVGIRLQPWGVLSCVPLPAVELRDVLVPLDALASAWRATCPTTSRETDGASRVDLLCIVAPRHTTSIGARGARRRDCDERRPRRGDAVRELSAAWARSAAARGELVATVGCGRRCSSIHTSFSAPSRRTVG